MSEQNTQNLPELPKLIGLGGYLRAGKDEVAKHLAQAHGYTLMGMSDALNEALQVIGPEGPWVRLDFAVYPEKPWEHALRRGKYHKGEYVRYRDLLAAVGYVEAKRHQDVREYLQGLGTEVGRDMISKDVWVNIAKKKILEHWAEGRRVVITAIRFPNELDMLAELDGLSVWIDRPAELRGATEKNSSHASENSVNSEQFRWWLNNNDSLEELYKRVDALLSKEAEGWEQ